MARPRPHLPLVVAVVLVIGLPLAGCGGARSTGSTADARASVAASGTAHPGGPRTGPGATPAAALPSGAPERPTGPIQEAALDRVVDGDTIRVRVGGILERVRYIGINAPELNSGTGATPQPFAEAAAQANARLLAAATRLVLERQISERDEFGRLLRDVWVETGGQWLFVNLVLVAEGYAQAGTWPPDVEHAQLLLDAQRLAQREGRGLWGRGP